MPEPHCCSQPLPEVSERDGGALDTGKRREFATACHLLSFRQEGCGHRGSPLWGLPIPGDTTWPGYLQSWAHVGSDRQELYPVLVILVAFLLSAPSGKQTVILFKHHSPLELWWRKESSIHIWSISSFTPCPIVAVSGGGCILACSSSRRTLEAGDTLLVGGRKLAPNILTRGT